MEFLTELKHAFGIERNDQEKIEKQAIEAFKEKQYKTVIELCSRLNWNKKAFSSDLAYALCFSIWYEPGNDSEIFDVAKNCVEFYDEPRFKEILSYHQEYLAKKEFNEAKYSKQDPYDFAEYVNEQVIETLNNALSWKHDNQSLKDRIKETISEAKKEIGKRFEDSALMELKDSGNINPYDFAQLVNDKIITMLEKAKDLLDNAEDQSRINMEILKAYDSVGEQYYQKAYSYSDNWKERPKRESYLMSAESWFERSKNNERLKMVKTALPELEKKISEDKKTLGRPLNSYPEASGFCNKLMKAGYETVGDVLEASESELDGISGIGTKTMSDIRAFRNNF